MSFPYEKLTKKSQEAFILASEKCRQMGNLEQTSLHLLHGLLAEKDGYVRPIFDALDCNWERLNKMVENELKNLVQKTARDTTPKMSEDLKCVLIVASEEAKAMKDDLISTEHLLLAMEKIPSRARSILWLNNVGYNGLFSGIRQVRGNDMNVDIKPNDSPFGVNDIKPKPKKTALSKYGIDLVEQAKKGKVDPVIGRDAEIRSVVEILSRRRKNNPVLIGEPGVGKTAIAEGLALRIADNDVPDSLKNKQVVSLDIGALVAGTILRGQFEQRIRVMLREVKIAAGHVILFIDELHTLIGAGDKVGNQDAANLLKPALARGELRCIGATTLDEYRKYIEKDAALERRFHPVFVGEPTVEDTITILRGLKPRYEAHHKGIKITDSALVVAAEMSHRYISDRFLPDKAIDLIDQAMSRLAIEHESVPAEIDTVQRRLVQLKLAAKQLAEETEPSTKEQLSSIEKEIKQQNKELKRLRTQWYKEKNEALDVHQLRSRLDEVELRYKTLETEINTKQSEERTIDETQYQELYELEQQRQSFTALIEDLDALPRDTKKEQVKMLLRQVVDPDIIAEVVSSWTGIPVNRMMETERAKLLGLEERLHQRLVGQNEAVNAVANAVRRSRSGLQDPNRPIGSFLFLGPTGVGKTELCKALAEVMFDDANAMVRIDMSEFMEKTNVSRLIGAAPGYVGYEEGGMLTEAVRKKPYSVVLFDEVEKAHRDVFNVLLQVLDDGRLSDNQGHTVNFTNTIIVMTSNIGSQVIQEITKENGAVEAMQKAVNELLRQYFLPEFLNRIDDTIIFHPLNQEEISQIVQFQLEHLTKRLDKQGMEISFSKKATSAIAEQGYDPMFGARPLKRVIQSQIVNPLAIRLLEKQPDEKQSIAVDYKDGGFVFK